LCRLFGFRSVILSQVHSSLVGADNALSIQSTNHPDGWGVAYYLAGAPHLIKSEKAAVDCHLFEKVSGIVSSQTVLAHLRKATLGNINILNTHPFQYGNWVFAHNGNIKNFEKIKDSIKEKISPELKRFILGETDSELLFYLLLTFLSKKTNLSDKGCSVELLADSAKELVSEIVKIAGPYSNIDNAGEKETYLTFIITNGSAMLAHQGGKNLYYSTYKKKCGDRDTCASFSPECEAPTESGYINHLIFSSEPLSGENIWIKMEPGEVIGVDEKMNMYDKNLKIK